MNEPKPKTAAATSPGGMIELSKCLMGMNAAESGLEQAKQHLAELKAVRAAVALDGGAATVAKHSRDLLAAAEDIETWKLAVAEANRRYDAALAAQGAAETEHEAAEARKRVPGLERKWLAFADALAAVKRTWSEVDAEEKAIDELLARARRAGRKDLLVSFHAVRAVAAEKVPRPDLGPNAVNVMQEDDNIKRLGLQAANVALQHAVHYRDEFAARKNNVLVTALPSHRQGEGPVVRAVDPEGGRKHGGLGRGVS
jgi:hypothetical protein